jgi:hypothetical protein
MRQELANEQEAEESDKVLSDDSDEEAPKGE